MVMLLFYVGEERYACDCGCVVEIIPRVTLKPVAHAPAHLAGLIRYNGVMIPVLEFARMRDGRPCNHCLSTRIIILRETPQSTDAALIGLIAERVTQIIPQNPSDFQQQTVAFKNAQYLAGALADEYGVIQLVETDKLFPLVNTAFSEA